MVIPLSVIVRGAGIVCFSLLVTSCVTETTGSLPPMKFSDTAVVSVQDPDVTILAGSTFSWLPEAVHFYKDKRLQDTPIKPLIESQIIRNLKDKKMNIVESANGASYAVAYMAALESALDDTAIIRRYGLLPGKTQVPEGDSNIEKGSLIIYVFSTRTDEVVWRSAAQMGVRFDMEPEQRKRRIEHVVAEMFQTFPVKSVVKE